MYIGQLMDIHGYHGSVTSPWDHCPQGKPPNIVSMTWPTGHLNNLHELF